VVSRKRELGGVGVGVAWLVERGALVRDHSLVGAVAVKGREVMMPTLEQPVPCFHGDSSGGEYERVRRRSE